MKRVIKSDTSTHNERLSSYIDLDDLHRVMTYNRNFEPLSSYRLGKNMCVITQNDKELKHIGPYGAVDNTVRYFKFYLLDDNTWEAVEVDNDTTCKVIGKPFAVEL